MSTNQILNTAYFEPSDSYWRLKQLKDGRYKTYFQVSDSWRHLGATYHTSFQDAQARYQEGIDHCDAISLRSVLETQKAFSKLSRAFFQALDICRNPVSWYLISKGSGNTFKSVLSAGGSLIDRTQLNLYAFETKSCLNVLRDQQMTQEEILSLIGQVCHDFNIISPKVEQSSNPCNSSYQYSEHAIVLGASGMDKLTVLHEIAHCLHVNLTFLKDSNRKIARPHGSEFVKIALDLYSHYGGLDHKMLWHEARKYNLIGPQEPSDKIDFVHKRMNHKLSSFGVV